MSSDPLYPASSPPNAGMGTGTKVLLGCLLGGGFLLLLLCCGVAGFAWYATRAAITDPAEVDKLSKEIVAINLPPDFKPVVGFSLALPIVNQPLAAGAVYADEKAHALLQIVEFRAQLDEKQRQAFLTQLQQSMAQQGAARTRIQVQESKVHEVEIHGETAKFTIAKGTAAEGDGELWQVTGEFAGSGGPAMLEFVAPADKYSEEAVIEMLDSMK